MSRGGSCAYCCGGSDVALIFLNEGADNAGGGGGGGGALEGDGIVGGICPIFEYWRPDLAGSDDDEKYVLSSRLS